MELKKADLMKAQDESWYFIAGCGGDLAEWVKGYEEAMKAQDIGAPTEWFVAQGWEINDHMGVHPPSPQAFPGDLTCLLFPLDGLALGGLAMFKIAMGDRWFDDVVQNARRSA